MPAIASSYVASTFSNEYYHTHEEYEQAVSDAMAEEWKGSFYPEKIQPEAMLAWYAERLPSVEINNTFYQMPKVEVLERWAQATPEAFRFSIKAPKRITHDARLAADAAADSVAYLYKNLAALGAKRGPVLFQLPPFLKKDTARLQDFLQLLPEGHRAAFEFRHDSWFDDDVYALLKTAGASLVPVRARRQHAAAAGGDGALGLRAAAAGELQRCRPGGLGRTAGGDAMAGGARVLHARADRARLRGGAAGVRGCDGLRPSVLRPAVSVCLQVQ